MEPTSPKKPIQEYPTAFKAQAIQLMDRALKMAKAKNLGPAVTGPLEQSLGQWKK